MFECMKYYIFLHWKIIGEWRNIKVGELRKTEKLLFKHSSSTLKHNSTVSSSTSNIQA